MNKLVLPIIAMSLLSSVVWPGDLYKVNLQNRSDAELLNSIGVEPVYRILDGYLVIADKDAAERLNSSGIIAELLETNIEIDQLAVDNRPDRENVGRFPLVFEEGDLRIFRVDDIRMSLSLDGSPLIPIDNSRLEIEYQAPIQFNSGFLPGEAPLDSLIDLISQDSVDSYLHRLEAFNGRLTGTDSIYAARDWIASKFTSFGYDSVVLDSFTGVQLGNGEVPAFNVVAYKIGSRYPGRQIVIGAHHDAVDDSPGVDDNGSGTVGVLEIARVLHGIETEMTFIFITFDSEESGLRGAQHYADAARERGDTIVYMLNMDMIGHIANDNLAKLYIGPGDEAFALLWNKLADSLLGVIGVLSGSSGSSDHAAFAQAGYDVTFVHEFIKSSEYHKPSDSTTYINFDYLTKMIKGSLATAYMVNFAPAPVMISSVLDVGDGQSLQVNWGPGDLSRIDHYMLHYTEVPASQPESIFVPADSSSYIVDQLIEEQQYSFYLIAYDIDGRSSIGFDVKYGTPYTIPLPPTGLTAHPIFNAVELEWHANNMELDFDHYAVVRDGALLADFIYDTSYTDPLLGSDPHDYLVRAVDSDGNYSDTAGIDPVTMKAATLQEDRILAINRSGSNSQALVNETVTGEFMREALAGWNFDYFSDTASSNPDRAKLIDMVDYGLVIIGAEAGRQDDLYNDIGNILGDLGEYLSIGGKAIVFGRWGDIALDSAADSVYFTPGLANFVYTDYFHIAFRIRPLSFLNAQTTVLESDFVGAQSLISGYPTLVWDSAAAADHTDDGLSGITGIPCPSLPVFTGWPIDTIYTYVSSVDSPLTQGRPIAWRYLGGEYEYVYFEIPLTFMERNAAVTALRKAAIDLGMPTAVSDDDMTVVVPGRFNLAQNYPNPFNPNTIIEFSNPENKPIDVILEVFNILGQRIRILHDGPAAPGLNRIEWDGRDDANRPVASGIYFYRLKADGEINTRKMILLK